MPIGRIWLATGAVSKQIFQCMNSDLSVCSDISVGARAFALPAADEAKAQRVQRSAGDEGGLSPRTSAGHRKRTNLVSARCGSTQGAPLRYQIKPCDKSEFEHKKGAVSCVLRQHLCLFSQSQAHPESHQTADSCSRGEPSRTSCLLLCGRPHPRGCRHHR